ncbi:hypothetical protein HK096_000500, partial [Nowakowskiella sp. JEL0078]
NLMTQSKSTPKISQSSIIDNNYQKRPVVIGGTNVDITAKEESNEEYSNGNIGESVIGTVRYSVGGVGRNIAEASFRTGGNPYFVSAVGKDSPGDFALENMSKIGMDVRGIRIILDKPTAVYNAMLNAKGELIQAIADMEISESIISNTSLNY